MKWTSTRNIRFKRLILPALGLNNCSCANMSELPFIEALAVRGGGNGAVLKQIGSNALKLILQMAYVKVVEVIGASIYYVQEDRELAWFLANNISHMDINIPEFLQVDHVANTAFLAMSNAEITMKILQSLPSTVESLTFQSWYGNCVIECVMKSLPNLTSLSVQSRIHVALVRTLITSLPNIKNLLTILAIDDLMHFTEADYTLLLNKLITFDLSIIGWDRKERELTLNSRTQRENFPSQHMQYLLGNKLRGEVMSVFYRQTSSE